MFNSKKKQLIQTLLNYRNVLDGVSGAFILVLADLFTIVILGRIFIPKIPGQPHVRDITVVIPPNSVDISANAIRAAGFRRAHAISYDSQIHGHPAFSSFRQAHGSYGDDVGSMINTTFILFGGSESFKVPQNLPSLPNRVMVIGYSFQQCYENGFALLLPTQLEYSMITRDAMKRFAEFSNTVLRKKFTPSEAFRAFCDFHSLHLLVMPCGKSKQMLPKWEQIDVLEYENPNPPQAWDTIEKIEEVWKIRKLV